MNTLTTAYISDREREVLQLISEEYTCKEIASLLYVSDHTVISHRKNLMRKLKAKNTAGLVRKGFEKGVLNLQLSLASWHCKKIKPNTIKPIKFIK